MVLVILSEKDPIGAIKTVMLRCSYVLIPLSGLLIKYYPELGRGYSQFTFEPVCIGASLGKNELGITLVVCGLFVFWEFLDVFRQKAGVASRIALLNHLLLLGMTVWLLYLAKSATSLACTILGAGGLVMMRLRVVQKRCEHLVAYSVVGALLLFLLASALDLGAVGAQMLGRDPSLTGRTEIWELVLKGQANPVLGAGFYTFWMGDRADKLSQSYAFHLNQAHNGYLETYLDGGVVGVCLLIALLAAGGRMLQKRLMVDMGWGSIAFTFWVIAVVHNWTEASFARLNLLWFVLVLVCVQYSRSSRAASLRAHHEALNSSSDWHARVGVFQDSAK
jgi:O-antigen ligase